MVRTKDVALLLDGRPVELHAWREHVATLHAQTVILCGTEFQAAAPDHGPSETAMCRGLVNVIVSAICDGSDLSLKEVNALTVGEAIKLFIAIGQLNLEVWQASMRADAATPKEVKL